MPGKKSRAPEARERRRKERLAREILIAARHIKAETSSSDDDELYAPPTLTTSKSLPNLEGTLEGTSRKRSHSPPVRYLSGKRLLYGDPEHLGNLSQGDTPDNASFSDVSVHDRPPNHIQESDVETDISVRSGQLSNSNDSSHNVRRGEGDDRLDSEHRQTPSNSEGQVDSDMSVHDRPPNDIQESDVETDISVRSGQLSTSNDSSDNARRGEGDDRLDSDEHRQTPSNSEAEVDRQTPSNSEAEVDRQTPFNSEAEVEESTVKEDVARFVCNHSLSMTATKKLLSIFKKAGVTNLPTDRRSLLKTPRSVPGVIEKCGGSFKYFGLESGIIDFLKEHPRFAMEIDDLALSVSVDGLPLHKSTKSQFWPILCRVAFGEPFIVGLYHGFNKPTNVDDFFQEFFEEYEHFKEHGVGYNGKRYNVHLSCWVCDAPARAFVKCIKGHTGYYACERCRVKGYYEDRKVVYPADELYEPRTDADFANMRYNHPDDGDEHQTDQQSPLIGAGINCVSGVVIDTMHCVYLGTWRRFLQYLFTGSRNGCRLSHALKTRLNRRLMTLRLPSEFSRQPRSVFDMEYWKATEYRSSLLYTGLVFLKGIVSPDIYALYLKLAVAMNILHTENDEKRTLYLGYARALLLEFIRDSKHLLGSSFVVYNVHSMSHIPDDVENFQCSVNHLSAFPFENHLQSLKKLVKTTHNPIGQVFFRLSERREQNIFKHKKVIEPYISTRSEDSIFYLHNTKKFAMIQRKRRRDGRYDVLLFSSSIARDYFQEPLASTTVGIYLVKNLDNVQTTPSIMSKDELTHKVVVLPLDNGRDYVLIPMLHDAEI